MPQRKPASVTPLPAGVKLFVLDTNVLMHDPTSLFRFEEHDVYLPIGTLEELDSNKKGVSDVARNARQASRFLDEMVSGESAREGGAGTRRRVLEKGRAQLLPRARPAGAEAARERIRLRRVGRAAAVRAGEGEIGARRGGWG